MARVIKKISDLEMLEGLTSTSNVIVEEGGEAKLFPAANIGSVKTVNGIEPDENGNIEVEIPDVEIPEINYPVTSVNGQTGDVVIEVSSGSSVQADMAQNDPAQPDYVKNRTHWVDGNQTVIEWDGNTEGLEFFTAEVTYYHVSDSTPTIDELIGASYETDMVDSGVSATSITSEMLTVFGDCIAISAGVPLIIIATIDNAATGDSETKISKAGVYFINASGYGYASKLTYGSTIIHTLDEKFIPDTIARVSDIPEGSAQINPDWNQNDPTQPDYVKNRTHWVEGSGATIEWDGNTDGRESAGAYAGFNIYPVSDLTPSINEMVGGKLTFADGQLLELTEDRMMTVAENVVMVGEFSAIIAYKENATFTHANSTFMFSQRGVYFIKSDDGGFYVTSLTYGSTTYHPLDEAFIPDTIARKSDIPEVNYPVTSVNGMTGDVTIDIPAVPTSLPSPNAITFTGAVEATYDGSSAVSVEIPAAEKELPEATADNNGAFLRIANGVPTWVMLEIAEEGAY